MPDTLLPSAVAQVPDRLWRSLYFYSAYRLILGGVFLFLFYPFSDALWLGSDDSPLFFWTSLSYFSLALVSLWLVRRRQFDFDGQLGLQLIIDILGVTLLSSASGGITSGLGVLLLVSLAAAGLFTRGRMMLLYPALASIASLMQHGYAVLYRNLLPELFMQVGLLCLAYFAVSGLAATLARYARASEELALQRGIDLANMAEANRLLIHDLPDGVLVVDHLGVVRQSNPSAGRLLGPGVVAEGAPLTQCAPRLAALFDRWCGDPAPAAIQRLPDSSEDIQVRLLPVLRDGFWGAVIVLEDQRRVLEQAQQLKLAALGRLTASIAHEVRNPLSSISYASELLREEKRKEGRDRLIQLILSNVGRLNRLVQDIMQLNRRDRTHQECFDLTAQLSGLIDEFIQPGDTRRDTISVEIAMPLPVCFDRGHLEQVLWNLCGNALRYCQKQAGSILLRGWRDEMGGSVLEIADDGPGIAEEARAHLFEPFFTTSATGTGLGLYISRELCEANGARLEYRPSELGSCFRITFGEVHE